tara:strand:- start:336 stop:713 length:378 start_codon:yes stop_codon:yes gene_type:complete
MSWNKKPYKYDEIENYFIDKINDYKWKDILELLEDGDLHHEIFNTDYFVIYHYEAMNFLGEATFQVIDAVKEWEQFNFGEVTTDLTSPQSVVNMYAYIIGEEVIYKYTKDRNALLELYKNYRRVA